MDYSKKVLVSTQNHKITYHTLGTSKNDKCVITFGELDSNMEEVGFGSKNNNVRRIRSYLCCTKKTNTISVSITRKV